MKTRALIIRPVYPPQKLGLLLGDGEYQDKNHNVASGIPVFRKAEINSDKINRSYPIVVGSMRIFPVMMIGIRRRHANTTASDETFVRRIRPRLNLSNSAAKGNNAITDNQTTENLRT
jgi:hypothetical protein